MTLIQLPNDVVSVGYQLISSYRYEQVFYSPSNNFTGTEKEFLRAKLAYRYRQVDKYTRLVFN